MTENALITNADMVFDDIGGRNGRNFKLTLTLETIGGGGVVSFNPMRLPQLLEQLGLEQFSELKGTYVQIPNIKIGEQVTGIKSIMAKDSEKWFETENHIYFGSEFFKGENVVYSVQDGNWVIAWFFDKTLAKNYVKRAYDDCKYNDLSIIMKKVKMEMIDNE